jgi:hypothetical protein
MSIVSAATAPDLDALATLRRRIADVERGDVRPAFGFATGVSALDAALHGTGGVPRGRLTELLGADGSGTTTLARRLVARALADGAWVAYVDATRTLAPRDWAGLGRRGAMMAEGMAVTTGRAGVDAPLHDTPERLWVVRPPDATRAAWCADVLLRSGGFGLVVVDGAPVLSRAVAMRLLQLARDADAALVLLGAGTRASDLAGALRLRVRAAPGGYGGHALPHAPSAPPSGGSRRWRSAPEGGGWHAVQRTVITVEKGGIHRTVEVSCAVGVARRLCAHPEVPDRRPVARPAGSGGHVDVVARGPDAADPGTPIGGVADGTLPERSGLSVPDPVRRGRRAGESTLGRRRAHR